jgi:simple sugar transport system permease protein
MSAAFLVRGHGLAQPAEATPVPSGSLISGFGLAMIGTLWAYEGWQFVTYSAGEARHPQRTFPRAIVLGTGALPLPAPVLVPTIMAAAMLAGALLLLGPTFLKTRFGVDEVVTTLLLNFVMVLFVSMLLDGALKDPMGLGWPQSKKVIVDAQLPKLIQGKRLHLGFLIAIGAALLVWFINARTTFGYEMRAVGFNPRAARFAGIPVNWVMAKTALLSGGLAALAGVSEVAGLKGNLTLDLSPGFGYTGIVVAMLAMLHPIGVIAAAIFVAAMFVGADAMSRTVGVPNYIANVMVATALLTMVTAMLFTRFRLRWR